MTDFISDLGTDYDAIDNFISTPDDTRQGNFSDLTNLFGVISFKHEDCSSWNGNLPVEASVLIGVNEDKDGNVEVTAGVSAIAAAYLTEETIYINISAFKDLLQGVYD